MSPPETTQASAAAFEGVCVRYGRTTLLDNFTMRVAPGSFHAILGRNGTGKSSLIRCLLGLQKPSSGHTRLFGLDSWSERPLSLARVAVVPEEPDAPAAQTVPALARLLSRVHKSWSQEALLDRVTRLSIPMSTPFGNLSRGQKTLAMFALALASRPRLLILDEPTLGLDAVARKQLYTELLDELATRPAGHDRAAGDGKHEAPAILIATHDLDGIENLADRVTILGGRGPLVDEPLENLRARYRRLRYSNERTETRTRFGNELDEFDAVSVKVRGWGIEAIVSDFDPDKFARLVNQDGVLDAEAEALTLEEIFLAVAGPEKSTSPISPGSPIARLRRGLSCVTAQGVVSRDLLGGKEPSHGDVREEMDAPKLGP